MMAVPTTNRRHLSCSNNSGAVSAATKTDFVVFRKVVQSEPFTEFSLRAKYSKSQQAFRKS
jgi:hypothetical protein